MGYRIDITGECDRVVGDYTDVGEVPPGMVSSPGIKRQVDDIYCYDEPRSVPAPPLVFTVLLREGGAATVRGHALKLVEPAHGGNHYAILERRGADEVIVGLFETAHVRGIFSGQLAPGSNGA